jgi:glycosyltransferase involved in cell wall biosynthesis
MSWPLIAVVLPLVTGMAISCAFWGPVRGVMNWIAKALVGFGLGLGVSSCVFFLCLLVGARSRAALLLADLVSLAGAVALFLLARRRQELQQLPRGREDGVLFALLAAVFLAAVFVAARTEAAMLRLFPHGGWDSWAIWTMRARFLFRSGEEWRDAFSPVIRWSHPDYPILLPATIARLWTYWGREALRIPIKLGLVFTACTAGLAVSNLAVLRGKSQALLAGTVLATTPFLLKNGAEGYAEAPFIFFALSTVVLLLMSDHAPRMLVLAGLSAGFAAWTKNEGLLLIVCLVAGLVVAGIPVWGWRAGLRYLSLFLAGVLPVLAVVMLFKSQVQVRDWLFQPGAAGQTMFERVQDMSRYAVIAKYYAREIFAFGGWQISVVPVLIAYFFLLGRVRGLSRKPGLLAAMVALGLTFFGGFFVYVISPFDPQWQLSTSLNRVLLELWPATVVVFFSITRTPEEALSRTRSVQVENAVASFSAAQPLSPFHKEFALNPPAPKSFRLSVLVPVYNERHVVEGSLHRVQMLEHELISSLQIIVVDDCSTDGTWNVLERVAAEDSRITLLRHERNQGKGAAIRTALAYATGDITVVHDADFEYNPADIPALLLPFAEEGADAVFGSRYLSAPYRRALMHRHTTMNKMLTSASNWLTDLNLTDLETGYKAVNTMLLKSIPLRSNDFRFEVEIVFKLAKRRARIFEVPIRYTPRTYVEGKKIRARDGLLALGAMLRHSLVDDLYAVDEYGSHILAHLERARRFNIWLGSTLRPYVGERVLEIGAGIGSMTNQFIPRDLYVASDINPNYLRYLNSYSIGKPYLHVREVDATRTEHFMDLHEQFDTVLIINVLEHLPNEDQVLRHLWSALAPGGRIIVLVPYGQRLYGSLDEALGHLKRYSEDELRETMTRAGFAVEKIFDFNRASVPGWWFNGKILGRRNFSRVQIKILELLMPVLRRIDGIWPWHGQSVVGIGRKPAAMMEAGRKVDDRVSASPETVL